MFTVALASCGGGSDGPGKCYSPTPAVCYSLGVDRSLPQALVSPTGLYRGLTSDGRSIAGLVLDDGSFYAIYSGVGQPLVAAGGIQGTMNADKQSLTKYDPANFSITDAVDTNFEGLGTQLYGISGTFIEKKSIQGSIFYPGTPPRPTFSANYSADYELGPNLADIAGNYSGTSGTIHGSETVTFDINGSGAITGIKSSGCTFSGTINPRTSGNAYNVTITFGPSPCPYPGATVNGVSYFDRTSNIAYAMASISAGSANFITIATKK
jgi:hypothetical protein